MSSEPEAQMAALIDALAQMKPSGRFHKSRQAVEIDETEDWPAIRVEVRANKLVGPKVARYIASANPEVVGGMLAELRRLHAEREADRAAMRDARDWMLDQGKATLSAGDLEAVRKLNAAIEKLKARTA